MTFEEVIQSYASDGILHLGSRDRKERLQKVLSLPFDPDIHYLLAYIHLHYAMLDEAEEILGHTVDKDDETYKQLKDYFDALNECDKTNIGIFPLTVSFRNRWNGPHLEFPEFYNDKKRDSWFPLRVNYIENGKIHVFVGKQKGDSIEYGDVELPSTGDVAEGTMGEIGFYGEDYLIRYYEVKEWVQLPELNAVREKVAPIIEKSNRLLYEKLAADFDSH